MCAWPAPSKWVSAPLGGSETGAAIERNKGAMNPLHHSEAMARAPRALQPSPIGSRTPPHACVTRPECRGVAAPAPARGRCGLRAVAARARRARPGGGAERAARARRHRLGRLHARHRTEARRRDHARDPRRPRLHRRSAPARIPDHGLAAAGRRVALARQHHRRHRPALRLGAVPGPRPERQRVRAAGRLRRRPPRPDRDHGDARRARVGARARDVARHAAPHRAQHLGRLEALAGRPGGAGPRHAGGRRAATAPTR